MDEETIQAIEDRGYDPTVIIALMEGIRSGSIHRSKETFHEPIIRVMSPKYAKKEVEKENGKILKRSNYSCDCVKCGARIQTFTCPHCLHNNYEIMAIKGELSK